MKKSKIDIIWILFYKYCEEKNCYNVDIMEVVLTIREGEMKKKKNNNNKKKKKKLGNNNYYSYRDPFRDGVECGLVKEEVLEARQGALSIHCSAFLEHVTIALQNKKKRNKTF